MRRASDERILTKNQLEDLIKKVEDNHDAAIRYESITDRLSAVEMQVRRLRCYE